VTSAWLSAQVLLPPPTRPARIVARRLFGASRTIASAFASTRLGVLLIGVIALSLLPIDTVQQANNCVNEPPAPRPLEMWSRWDAPWYLAVVEHGYTGNLGADCDMRPTRFPLYPALVWTARLVIGNSLAAGILVSNAALGFFLFALWRLVEMDFDTGTAARVVWLYLLFPSGFFLSGVYSESVMLATTVGATLAARQSRWPTAGVLAAFAALSHPVGALVLILVAVEYLASHGYSLRRLPLREVGWLLLPSAVAFGGYGCFSARAFGNPLAFLAMQQDYRGTVGWPGQAFVRFWESGPRWHGYNNSVFDAALAILALSSLPFIFRHLRLSYGLYVAASVLVPLSTSLVSFSRILLGAFPCFILIAATTTRKAILIPLLVLCAILLGVFTVRFATWHWVA